MRAHVSPRGAIAFFLLFGTSSPLGSCGRILLTTVRTRLEVEDAELKSQDQQLHPHSDHEVDDVKLHVREIEAVYAKLRLDEEAGMPKPRSQEAEVGKPKRRNHKKMASRSSEAEAGQSGRREAGMVNPGSQVAGKPREQSREGGMVNPGSQVAGKPRGREGRKRGRRPSKPGDKEAGKPGTQEATKTASQEAVKTGEASSKDPSEPDASLEHDAEDAKVAIDALSEHEAEDATSKNPWSMFSRSEQDLIKNVAGPWKKVTIWCLSDLLTEDEVSEERQELVDMVQEIREKGLKLDVETQEFDREKKWSDKIHADASKDFDRPQFGCFVVIDSVNVGGHERGQEHGKYVGGYDEFVKAFVKNYCGPPSGIRDSSLCMAFRAKTQES